MPFANAQEAFDDFQRTGNYANSPKHFANEADWSAYKHMVPQDAKKAFREKVAGNEARAIEGMSQGLTREQMGIFNRPEEGQALYRRLGQGLGTGLDMNKAYDWGGGTALEVGTSDLAKRGIERRGITGDERQRYADFQRAGSPEAYFRNYRQGQIQDLLGRGAIERDPATGGYRNPGAPGGGSYGANLEGYNLGQNVLGHGRGTGGASVPGGGYTPQGMGGFSGGGMGGGGNTFASYPGVGGGGSPSQGYSSGSYSPGSYSAGSPSSPTGSAGYAPRQPAAQGGAALGFGSYAPPGGGGIGGGQNFQIAGGSAAPPMSMGQGGQGGGGAQMPQYAPLTGGGGSAKSMGGPEGPAFAGAAGASGGGGGNTIYERPPGQVGPFGAPGTGNPSGNSLFPAVPTPGSPGNPFPDPNNPTGGGFVPGWRPEGNLPGINIPQTSLPGQFPVSPSGLPPGMGGFEDFAGTPYAGLLGAMGAGDLGVQGFNLQRAMQEYGGAGGLENTVLGQWGDALGVDPRTGQALQGPAADVSSARSFGRLAPQVSRIMSDTDAMQQRLRRDVPEGGEKTAATSDLLRQAQGQIGGLRQGQAAEALGGINNLMMAKKSFDPGAYTGGAQSLLDAYGQGRGQDIGAYGQGLDALLGMRGQDLQGLLGMRGQDLDALLGQRGQDVQWGLGQGNLGLGWAGMGQDASQQAWQNYLTGRGQDIGLYSGTRGQDLDRLSQQEAMRAQQNASRQGFWGQLAGGVGSLLGGIFSDRSTKNNAQPFSAGMGDLAPYLWQASDSSTKEDVEAYSKGLDAVKLLQPYTYTYNEKVPALTGTAATGFMAQDVEKVIPDAVGEASLAAGTIKTLQPMRILATVVNAVKELDAKLDKGLAAYAKKGGRK